MNSILVEQTNFHATLPKDSDFSLFQCDLAYYASGDCIKIPNNRLADLLDLARLTQETRSILQEAYETSADYYIFHPYGSDLPM